MTSPLARATSLPRSAPARRPRPARRLSLNFDEADRNILFASATWDVEAKLHRIDDEGEVTSIAEVSGDQLSVVFDEITGDPERLEIALQLPQRIAQLLLALAQRPQAVLQ